MTNFICKRQIEQSHKYQQQLEDIEKQILEVLNKADNILDDEQGVQVLQQSKQVSNDIIERQQEAKVTEQRLEQSRQEYKPIANHSATLFFAIMDMAAQDFMYQYSLNWFINLYIDAFDKAERQKSTKPSDRVAVVSKYLTYSIYSNVCRSLFEKDKLLFSFLLLLRIQENKKHIDQHELHFLISPIDGSSDENAIENPAKSFLPQPIWLKIIALSKISSKFKNFPESFAENLEDWKSVYYDSDAHSARFAAPYNACTPMQRLCILKALRPDRINLAVQDFIRAELGEKFTTAPPFNLQQTFADSNCYQPLIFILPGTDPMNNLINFAESKQKPLKAISLGQGQGIHAERAIEEAQKTGSWVILQNCHLAPSWMPKLERICEEMQNSAQTKDKINVQFRLWLTSYPSADFPISILQNSVKMTNEPPKGVKSNMAVSYLSDTISDPDFFESNPKPEQFKTLLYGLCFFHAVLQERRTFGALGWNIFYDFNQSDLRISARQLHILLSEYEVIPFNALYYMVGECNYGGRVTDDRDRRILHALMQDFFSEALFEQDFNFANDPNYGIPKGISTHSEYLKQIEEKLPVHQTPGIFGFHDNGVIVRDLKETDDLCSALLLMMGGSAMRSAEGDSETELNTIAQDILSKIPKRFDPELVAAKYPITYDNSLNTVLQQEIIRYNNLTNVIVSSLKDIQNALLGVVVMSSTLEKVCASLLKGLVPDLWKKASYPSLKPLGSYINDLVKRLKYYQNWIDTEIPKCHWISGFYFTQTFLTATLQNYARKYSIPIDALTFEYVFYREPQADVEEQASLIRIEDGSLMHGLYIEGCKWDEGNKVLAESDPKVLSVVAPIIWLKPAEISSVTRQHQQYQSQQTYACPVYKTSERRGTLSTTGHSTNFIMSIDMPSEVPSAHWVKRGVAMLCQLSD